MTYAHALSILIGECDVQDTRVAWSPSRESPNGADERPAVDCAWLYSPDDCVRWVAIVLVSPS